MLAPTPEASADADYNAGLHEKGAKRFPAAVASFRRAVEVRPNFPEALEYLGEAYAKLGRLGDARAVLERLKPLDAARAQELEQAIRTAR